MNKDIIELLKGININMSIREIRDIIEKARNSLIDLYYELNDDNINKDIYRIVGIIDNTDIYDMALNEIKEYIDRLITIIDFCVQ